MALADASAEARTHLPPEARLSEPSDPARHDKHGGFLSDAQLETLGDWLDTRFSLFGFRFGLDGILSIVPIAGDVAGSATSAVIIADAWKSGARKRTLAKMAGNLGLDFVIGSIPIVGTLFDIGFKANVRNLALLKDERDRLRHQRLASSTAL